MSNATHINKLDITDMLKQVTKAKNIVLNQIKKDELIEKWEK